MEIISPLSELFTSQVVIAALMFAAMLFSALMAGIANVLFED